MAVQQFVDHSLKQVSGDKLKASKSDDMENHYFLIINGYKSLGILLVNWNKPWNIQTN